MQLTPVFLPGESPWTDKPGGLQSMGWQSVGHRKKQSSKISDLNFKLKKLEKEDQIKPKNKENKKYNKDQNRS